MKSNLHVSTAAEAISAGQFARLGFDVSVQYGANQPEYDLMIAEGGRALKISVKGSNDGAWGLTQTQLARLKGANYQGAVDVWLTRHKPGTAFCLVQFKDVPVDAIPRMYLAWPHEIALRLKAAAGGRGDTTLFESRVRGPKASGAGTLERIPEDWRFSLSRIEALFQSAAASVIRTPE